MTCSATIGSSDTVGTALTAAAGGVISKISRSFLLGSEQEQTELAARHSRLRPISLGSVLVRADISVGQFADDLLETI